FPACSVHLRKSLLDQLREILHVDIQANYTAPREGDILHSYGSTEYFKKTFGFAPRTSFADGLRQTVDWFVQKSLNRTPVGGIDI
ncbi:MAG: hypothetical protein ACE5GA_09850, partial [Candidatus Zixiibacteriota bacterium]